MKNKKQSYRLFLALSVSLILFPNGFTLGAPENLDEIFLRKERLSQVTWGPSLLEDISNNYTWQPETLQYRDVITGNEVWRFSNTPNTLGGPLKISVLRIGTPMVIEFCFIPKETIKLIR